MALRRAGRALRRAVALDMDGTTLTSQHLLTQRTVQVIQDLDSRGVQVIIATGRPAPALQRFVDELSLPRPLPAVCFNGACALLMQAQQHQQQQQADIEIAEALAPTQRVLFSEGLTAAATYEVLSLCESMGWCASYSLPWGASAAPGSADQEERLRRFEALEGVSQERLPSLAPLLDQGTLPLKIVAMVEDPEASAAAARAALVEGLVHIVAAEMHVEFLSPTVNKGRSLARLCLEVLDLPLEEVVAYGDNNNDLEMLQLVGEGVAMRNAKDGVKAAADRECEWSNDDEGVAQDLASMLAAGLLEPRAG